MKNMKTPYFIIDKKDLDNNIDSFNAALDKYWGNSIIGYSFKTNSLPWILDYMKDKNCYAEVVSSEEYKLALHMGYDKSKIIFNGPVKGKEEFVDAIKNKAIINIDSKFELEWVKELNKNTKNINVGIRANFSLEELCPNEVGYEDDGTRFGFSIDTGEFYEVFNMLNELDNVNIKGIHLHMTSKTRSLNIYRKISKISNEIKRKTSHDFSYIDIGGGFFGGLPTKPSFDDYVKVISEELKKEYSPKSTTLIVEPGASVIASPISFVSSVVDIKDTKKSRIVTIDGSRMNVDPLMIKTSYFYKHKANTDNVVKKQVICGYTCMDSDRLMVLENKNELLIGDNIVFDKVGSYTMSLSPLFIEYFPEVYLYDEDSYTLIRKKWSTKEYVQKSFFE